MPSDNLCSALLDAWCHNLWRCPLNHFAIPAQTDWQFVSIEDIVKGILSDNFQNQDSKLWVAPIVWQKKINQIYWIPIWIPAVLKHNQIQLSKHQLPWMPSAQFSPATQSPFDVPFHCFDEWLRFEWLDEEGKLNFQDWTQAYPSIQDLLGSLSNNAWKQHIQAMEFTQENAIVVAVKESTHVLPNKLIQNFAAIWDSEPQISWDHKKCFQQAKEWGLEGLSLDELEAAVHVLALQEGELLGVRAPIGSKISKFTESIARLQANKGSIVYLFNQQGLSQFDPIKHWQTCDEIVNGSLLIIEDAQRFLPQQILPLLSQVKTALFLGDNQDIPALPLMSAMPESWDLAYHGIEDEECLDQLQYKGMLFSTGNAMSVALANSAYQQALDHGLYANTFSLLKETANPQYLGVMIQSESMALGNGLINEGEAQFIARWLTEGPLNKDWQNTAIVTPFVQQRNLIAHFLEFNRIPCKVMTFFELGNNRWPHVIFSPVYTSQQQRPFIFDQGEHLLYSLMRRAQKVWVVGSLDIFNPIMQSPSGKLGRYLTFSCVSQ